MGIIFDTVYAPVNDVINFISNSENTVLNDHRSRTELAFESMENRFEREILECSSLEEFGDMLKTKRFHAELNESELLRILQRAVVQWSRNNIRASSIAGQRFITENYGLHIVSDDVFVKILTFNATVETLFKLCEVSRRFNRTIDAYKIILFPTVNLQIRQYDSPNKYAKQSIFITRNDVCVNQCHNNQGEDWKVEQHSVLLRLEFCTFNALFICASGVVNSIFDFQKVIDHDLLYSLVQKCEYLTGLENGGDMDLSMLFSKPCNFRSFEIKIPHLRGISTLENLKNLKRIHLSIGFHDIRTTIDSIPLCWKKPPLSSKISSIHVSHCSDARIDTSDKLLPFTELEEISIFGRGRIDTFHGIRLPSIKTMKVLFLSPPELWRLFDFSIARYSLEYFCEVRVQLDDLDEFDVAIYDAMELLSKLPNIKHFVVTLQDDFRLSESASVVDCEHIQRLFNGIEIANHPSLERLIVGQSPMTSYLAAEISKQLQEGFPNAKVEAMEFDRRENRMFGSKALDLHR